MIIPDQVTGGGAGGGEKGHGEGGGRKHNYEKEKNGRLGIAESSV